jgi:alanine-synthesizing transaminase
MKFSNRFDWGAPANELGSLLSAKMVAGRQVYDLTQSNPTKSGFVYDAEAILAALAQPGALVYEPDPRGLPGARTAVAGYYEALGSAVDQGRIFLTAGTSEAYGVLGKLLGDPGDEVLIPRPGYPLLSYLMRFEGLRPVAYPLHYDAGFGWRFDIEVLSALVTPRTRAVLLVNPNNPTGSYVKEAELRALDNLCRRHAMALIVDEVFADYAAADAPGNRVASALGRTRCLCFVLNGFSKMLALPQVKLAWIAVGGDSRVAEDACGRLEALLDFYLTVSSQVQHASGGLLDLRRAVQDQIQLRLAQNSRFLHERAAGISHFDVLRREGGWYAIVDMADAWSDEARCVHLLDIADTLIHPGSFYSFGREGYVVLSLLPQPEVFRTGVERLSGIFGGSFS